MEIRFLDEWHFTAVIQGRERSFSVLGRGGDGPETAYMVYVEDAQAEAGNVQLQLGRIVREDGRVLLLEDDGRDPGAQVMLQGLQETVDTGRLAPEVCAVLDGQSAERGQDELPEYAPEDEQPEPDATAEERLLNAIFGQALPEGISPDSAVDRLGALLLDMDPEEDLFDGE